MNQTEALNLLLKMLAIPTVNGDLQEENLAKFICKVFHNYGVNSKIEPVSPGIANVSAEIAGCDSGHVIAVNGHLDTVPFGDITKWNTDPSVPHIQNGCVFARGASDMKSGLAAIVVAMCDISAKEELPRRTLRFLGTAGEEKDGIGAISACQSGWPGIPDLLIIGEPTNGNLGIAQKGCLWLKCSIKGKTSHAAYPSSGINAIEIGFDIYSNIKKFVSRFSHFLLGNATATITKIFGGIVPNMVPDYCEILMDIRTIPSLLIDAILDEADRIKLEYEKKYTGLSVEFEIINKRQHIETNTDDLEVVKIRNAIKKITGENPLDIGINYFTDASIFIEEIPNIPIVLLGPGQQELAHQPNEWVGIDDYLKMIEIYKEILKN